MENNKHIYFVSDAHLGLPDYRESRDREKLLVEWLDEIKPYTKELFLVGDLFDFWHEWKRVVPRGFTRFLGKICEFTDAGIPVHFFTGNHDVWVYDYLIEETGMILHRKEYLFETNNKKFYIAHGDGLGPGDRGFKLLKKVFTNRVLQWFFARLHPNFSMWLGNSWSVGRKYSQREVKSFGENELLVKHSRIILEKEHHDYFIYGHRHLPQTIQLNENAIYMNLGDWLTNFTYARFDGDKLELLNYRNLK